jgi:hypothetical protein
VKAWLGYSATALGVVLAGCAVAALVAPAEAARAVWLSGAVAWVLQLGAFAVLVSVRGRPGLFMGGWVAGLVLRFAALGALAWWLGRDEVVPRPVALLSLVGFMFILLLLEPLYLRRGLQTR